VREWGDRDERQGEGVLRVETLREVPSLGLGLIVMNQRIHREMRAVMGFHSAISDTLHVGRFPPHTPNCDHPRRESLLRMSKVPIRPYPRCPPFLTPMFVVIQIWLLHAVEEPSAHARQILRVALHAHATHQGCSTSLFPPGQWSKRDMLNLPPDRTMYGRAFWTYMHTVSVYLPHTPDPDQLAAFKGNPPVGVLVCLPALRVLAFLRPPTT
jgi:hypothetical protein